MLGTLLWYSLAWLLLAVTLGRMRGETLPAGSVLEVRLETGVASYTSRPGLRVTGVLVAPLRAGGRTLLPMGSRVDGTLRSVRRVGLGLWHETARLQLEFNRVELPGGEWLAFKSRLIEVENSRERVDSSGVIRGIRATGTLANRATNLINAGAMLDPIAWAFSLASSASLLRFSEPEILLPVGSEVRVRLENDVPFQGFPVAPEPGISRDPDDRQSLEHLVRSLPYRTLTLKSSRPSDITNVAFLGGKEALERAFEAAGWVAPDPRTSTTIYRTFRAITEDQGYHRAPMSRQTLAGADPVLSVSKTLNTFARRHHARIWHRHETWNARDLYLAAATQDVAVAFSQKNRTFIHVINEQLDAERDKIVNDLVFTGCVDGVERVERPWVPRQSRNATGDRMTTDGAIMVVKLNDCESPRRTSGPPDPLQSGKALQRGFRQVTLKLRDSALRGNLFVQGYEGVRYLAAAWSGTRVENKSEERTLELDGDEFRASTGLPVAARQFVAPARRSEVRPKLHDEHRWSPAFFELGLSLGLNDYAKSSLDAVRMWIVPNDPTLPPVKISLADQLGSSWAAGITVTHHAYRHVSNEFGYSYQRGTYRLDAAYLTGALKGTSTSQPETGMLTRQFTYSVLYEPRARGQRLRPYLAVGPVIQMVHLTDAPVQHVSGPWILGMRNIGIVKAAYNFSKEPPLNGGGLFQVGAQYGAGVRYRLLPRWTVGLDYRETASRAPDILAESLPNGKTTVETGDFHVMQTRSGGLFRQRRYTLSFAFTF